MTTTSIGATTSYPLLSDGWHGGAALNASTSGRLHVSLTSHGACAWLGFSGSSRAFLWPAGYRVRFDPIELIAPDGAVIGREGTRLSVGGGFEQGRRSSRCWGAATTVWNSMSAVKTGNGP